MYTANKLTFLQQEIVKVLKGKNARYSRPVSSFELSRNLNVTASYIRQHIVKLEKLNMVGVRRGSGGGFFLR
jgi:DNA-binding IscR family transcriptional regulator